MHALTVFDCMLVLELARDRTTVLDFLELEPESFKP